MGAAILVQDIGYALRLWKKAPGFVVIAALTVALGIGATTTIFSVVNSLMIRTLPGVSDPSTLVHVRAYDEKDLDFRSFSYPMFLDYRNGNNGMSGIAALDMFPATISTGVEAEPEVVSGMIVSSDYFAIVGTQPALGRFFVQEDDAVSGASPVVVLSHRYWRQRLGSDASIVGKTIVVNRTSLIVIGVAEEGFQGHVALADFSLWVPMAMAEALTSINRESRGYWAIQTVARLAPGWSSSRAQAAMSVTTERLRAGYPQIYSSVGVVVEPYNQVIDEVRGPLALFLVLLFSLSAIVLLIASVNVAGMLLSKASGRSREMAVRLAIGAARGRVVRQLLTESVLLFLLGGGAGVILAIWATSTLSSLSLPTPIPMAVDLTPDVRVLGFCLVLALVTGVLFGLAPALQVTKADLVVSLRDDVGATSGRRSKLRNVFVVAQVAGSAILLVGCGVFLRGLERAASVDLGFDAENVHVLTVDVSLHRYSEAEGLAFFMELEERAAALPGVSSVAVSTVLPLSGTVMASGFILPGLDESDEGNYRRADVNAVTSSYFETMQVPFVAGRSFDERARGGTSGAIVVNETAARLFWPDGDAIGKRLSDGDDLYEVVGVVGDGKYRSIGEPQRPMVYLEFSQSYMAASSLMVRSEPGVSSTSRSVREIVRALDSNLPVSINAPYSQIVGLSLVPNKVAAGVAGVFGAVGIALAAIGLYGVLSYAVTQRLREIGIRIALGADSGAVQGIVIRDGIKLVCVGLLCGLPLALGAATLIRGLLYGLSPADPISYCGIVALFVAVGLLASYVPARRATRVDPMDALRCE